MPSSTMTVQHKLPSSISMYQTYLHKRRHCIIRRSMYKWILYLNSAGSGTNGHALRLRNQVKLNKKTNKRNHKEKQIKRTRENKSKRRKKQHKQKSIAGQSLTSYIVNTLKSMCTIDYQLTLIK